MLHRKVFVILLGKDILMGSEPEIIYPFIRPFKGVDLPGNVLDLPQWSRKASHLSQCDKLICL